MSVKLGPVHVNVHVPLDLGALLGGRRTQQPTPTPSASTSTPPPSAAPSTAAAASRPPATHSGDTATGHRVSAYPPTSPHLTQSNPPPPPTTTTHTPSAHHHPSSRAADPRVVFAHGDFGGNGPLLLVLLCVVCGLGVAFVVRLSGGRRRL